MPSAFASPAGTFSAAVTGLPAGANPSDVLRTPDGSLWYTEFGVGTSMSNPVGVPGHVVRIRPGGLSTQTWDFTANDGPDRLAFVDGKIWFTEYGADSIGVITPAADRLPAQAVALDPADTKDPRPRGLTVYKGNIWFTEDNGSVDDPGDPTAMPPVPPTTGNHVGIGRVKLDGSGNVIDVREFPIPIDEPNGRLNAGFGVSPRPTDITPGPDGNLWYTERNWGGLGRVVVSTDSNTVTITHPHPATPRNAGPYGIITGPDGKLWYADHYSDSRTGQLAQVCSWRIGALEDCVNVPNANAEPRYLTNGIDGNVWFTDGAGRVGRIVPSTMAVTMFSISPFPTPVAQDPLPAPKVFNDYLSTIVLDSDGNFLVPIEGGTQIDKVSVGNPVAAPAVSGSPVAGQTLSCTAGAWVGAPALGRQWQRDGAAVPGATGATYVAGTADVNHAISCRITANYGSAFPTVVPLSAVSAAVLVKAKTVLPGPTPKPAPKPLPRFTAAFAHKQFTVKRGRAVVIRFKLSLRGKETVTLKRGRSTLGVLLRGHIVKVGPNSFVWRGRLRGRLVRKGLYSLVLTMTSPGHKAIVVIVKVRLK